MTTATLEKKGLVNVLSSWCLLAYDIPAKERKKRSDFLKRARALGAMKFTQSVYLLPNTPDTYHEAEELAALGEAYLWVSEIKEGEAFKVTQSFHASLTLRLAAIHNRIARIASHLEAGRVFIAYRMAIKTATMLQRVWKLAKASGFEDLVPQVEATVETLKGMMEGKGGGGL